jgi:hypothetical protein
MVATIFPAVFRSDSVTVVPKSVVVLTVSVVGSEESELLTPLLVPSLPCHLNVATEAVVETWYRTSRVTEFIVEPTGISVSEKAAKSQDPVIVAFLAGAAVAYTPSAAVALPGFVHPLPETAPLVN